MLCRHVNKERVQRFLVFVGVIFVLGCGAPPARPAQPFVPREVQPEVPVDREVAPRVMPPPAAVPTASWLNELYAKELSLGFRFSTAPLPQGAKGDVSGLYQKVGPATVIVHTPQGFGAGVIIKKTGWVLTAYHVVDTAVKEDFIGTVEVELGKLSELGRVKPQKTRHKAIVHKYNPLNDLALLRMVDPPKDLTAISISKGNPLPGEPVAKLGHPSNGYLWSIDDGTISSLGTLEEMWSKLVGGEGKIPQEAMEKFRTAVETEMPAGEAIQSTCVLVSGDSGGPLVDSSGELVGLNVFGLRSDAGQMSNFHVHVAEIREFLKEVPKKPAPMLPDPWRQGGSEAVYRDVDLDGNVDIVATTGGKQGLVDRGPRSYFLDVDQDSFETDEKLPPIEKVLYDEAFDAEVIFLIAREGVFVWYDTDNDDAFDLLLVDKRGVGAAGEAYQILSDGDLSKDEQHVGKKDISPELMSDAAMGDKLRSVAQSFFSGAFVEGGGTGRQALPDPLWGGGRAGVFGDVDGNGVVDTIASEWALSAGLIFDVDEDSLRGRQTGEDAAQVIADRSVDAEATIIETGRGAWVWYDTDDDGKFDLVLHAQNKAVGVATQAMSIRGESTVSQPVHLGQMIVRPQLLGSAERAQKMSVLAARTVPPVWQARPGDQPGALPNPLGTEGVVKPLEIKGWQKAVIDVQGRDAAAILVDVNRDTFDGKRGKRTAGVVETVRAGEFKAEFVYLERGGMAWVFYDTDMNGAFDLVLFSSAPSAGTADVAFRIDGSGNLELDEGAAQGKLVRFGVFEKKRYRKRFQKLAKELFNDLVVEQ